MIDNVAQSMTAVTCMICLVIAMVAWSIEGRHNRRQP